MYLKKQTNKQKNNPLPLKKNKPLLFHNKHVLIAKTFTTVHHVWLFCVLVLVVCCCFVVMSNGKGLSYHTCNNIEQVFILKLNVNS